MSHGRGVSRRGAAAGPGETAVEEQAAGPRQVPPGSGGGASSSRPRPPTVTVVMPAYNRAALIGASIESALGQTYPDLELLVVDDGSTDDTAAVVRAYAGRDRRVRLLAGAHRGMSATMNAGVRAARGRYYARLDSDDLWHRRFLEVTVPILERDPRVGVVYPRARTFSDGHGPPQPERGRPMTFPGQPFESMLVGDFASGAALVRVSCHERAGGYDEAVGLWEDWDFWLRASRHFDFHFVDEVLAYLRVHPGNVSSAGSAARWRSRVDVLDRAFAAAAATPPGLTRQQEALRAQAYRNVYLDVGRAHWSERDRAGAWRWFRDGLAISGAPIRSAGGLGYSLLLHHLGRVPHFWTLHGVLSRTRRALAAGRARAAGAAACDPGPRVPPPAVLPVGEGQRSPPAAPRVTGDATDQRPRATP